MDQMNGESKGVFAKTGVAVLKAWNSIFMILPRKIKMTNIQFSNFYTF